MRWSNLSINQIIGSLIILVNLILAVEDDKSTNDEVNLSTFDIAKLRKFEVENHYVLTEDNYIINVVRILPVNKLARGKRPVIFNHGSTQSSTYFVTNSVGARPIDLSNYNAGNMTYEDLEKLLFIDNDYKSITTSFPFLLACFGHDVWLINKRGTEFSLGRGPSTTTHNNTTKQTNFSTLNSANKKIERDNLLTTINDNTNFYGDNNYDRNKQKNLFTSILNTLGGGLTGYINLFLRPPLNLASIENTFDSSYWKFSFDEQAKYDLPAILKYVLNITKQVKVAYVGHSFGNGLMFMLQSQQPEWAHKVEPFLAWSPDFYLKHTTSILRPLLMLLQPILTQISFPFPPTPIDPLTRLLLATLCQDKLNQETTCRLLENSMWGFSGKQQIIKPAFVASQFYSISSHEAVQLAQDAEKGKMYFYDFGKKGNLKAYNSTEAPIYNVSKIISKSISFWHGEKDALATPTDVNILISDFSVPIDDRFITKAPFNHYDLLFGSDAPKLVNLPGLILIESYN